MESSQLTSQLLQGPVVDEQRKLTYPFYVYFRGKEQVSNQGPNRIGTPIALSAQNAAIDITQVTSETLTAGLYRVTYYARITSAAPISSSLTVNIFWDDGIVTCSKSFTTITGNTISTTGSESYMVQIDTPPLTFSTTYASNTAGSMQYSLSIVLEAISV